MFYLFIMIKVLFKSFSRLILQKYFFEISKNEIKLIIKLSVQKLKDI